MSHPVVSVAIITYNQEEYIEKALSSVLSQQSSFDFEVIIGDDCSTDKTSEICARFEQQYPGKVKHLQNKKNLGYIANLLQVIGHCSGDYIALLEADDHWISDSKLEDQVTVFRTHPDISLCFTNSRIDDTQAPGHTRYFSRDHDIEFTAADCLSHCVAPTSSFMFRRLLFTPPVWFTDLRFYEYMLIYILAGKGNIYYLNKLTACRTQHYRGISTLTDPGDGALMSDAMYRAKIIEGYPKSKLKQVRNIVLDHQIQTASFFISKKKFTLAKELIAKIKISKLTLSNNGGPLIIAYGKLLMKYHLAKQNIYTPKRAVVS